MKNLHIALSDDLVSRLDRVSDLAHSSQTALVREAVQVYLIAKERELVAQEMFRYACEMAPHSKDFVSWTGPEVDRLLESEEW